jgi:hypothetical protein
MPVWRINTASWPRRAVRPRGAPMAKVAAPVNANARNFAAGRDSRAAAAGRGTAHDKAVTPTKSPNAGTPCNPSRKARDEGDCHKTIHVKFGAVLVIAPPCF